MSHIPPEVWSVLLMFLVTFAVILPLTWMFERMMKP